MVGARDDELAGLRARFVCVRVVQMGGVDLSVFQFDPFLSWSVLFMNADKTIYGRYGVASPKSKMGKVDSNPNHSVAGLQAAMRRALELHAEYAKDPGAAAPLFAQKTGPKPVWTRVEDTPVAAKYKRMRRATGDAPRACVHCHEVQRAVVDSFFMTGRAVRDDMLWVYPRPSVLGLTMSRDHCARVTAVAAGSWAAAAGLRAGDDIERFAGQPLLSIADLVWVLHVTGDAGGALPVRVRRGEETVELELRLPDRWRRSEDFVWRYRLAGYASWLWGGVTLADTPRGPRVAQLSPAWFKKPNRAARQALRVGDVILEVDGRRGLDRSGYLAYLMRETTPGATVRLRVRRGGEEVAVEFGLPEVRPEVLGH